MRNRHLITGLSLAALLLIRGAGESSTPILRLSELPPEILNECAAVTVGASRQTCGENAYGIRWFGHASRANLFVVEHRQCPSGQCRAWFVEKGRGGARVVLELNGAFQLQRVSGSYPVVEVRRDLTESYTSYNRYVWNGERYVRDRTRLVHNIDGVECATEEECRAKADEALKNNRTDRAVRIWQQVHGIDWI